METTALRSVQSNTSVQVDFLFQDAGAAEKVVGGCCVHARVTACVAKCVGGACGYMD